MSSAAPENRITGSYGRFHGQQDVDQLLAETCARYGIGPGVFVDVGAADPIVDSNSYHFERNGWRVLCIEPNPYYAAALRQSRAEVYETAISDYENPDAPFSVYHLSTASACCMNAVSSLSPDPRLAAMHAPLLRFVSKISVSVQSLSSLLANAGVGRIDILSIDTEGTEMEVLRGLDFQRWRPSLILVENVYSDPALQSYLRTKSYSPVARLGVNDLYSEDR